MLFYLTTVNLAQVLYEDAPMLKGGETDKQVQSVVKAWSHSNFLCKNCIINSLDNTLYSVYSPIRTTTKLWESLEKKYKTQDVGLKKLVIAIFLEFKMINSKVVISQVQVLQIILHEIQVENMVLSESFQVTSIIKKFPPYQKDFKNYLKHKHKEMGLENLIVRLRIEEDNRICDKKSGKLPIESKLNIVEQKIGKKMKYYSEGLNQGKGKFKKFNGKCYVCNKQGH